MQDWNGSLLNQGEVDMCRKSLPWRYKAEGFGDVLTCLNTGGSTVPWCTRRIAVGFRDAPKGLLLGSVMHQKESCWVPWCTRRRAVGFRDASEGELLGSVVYQKEYRWFPWCTGCSAVGFRGASGVLLGSVMHQKESCWVPWGTRRSDVGFRDAPEGVVLG
jgi:hypothetical protein